MSLEPGTEFAGYTVVGKIGAGGMGEVYLARHPRLPRHDVIKVLAEHVSNDPTFRARFTREADLAAQLDHPCIVSVYDRGEVDGRLWISMQYVAGTDAAALIAATPGGLPLADVGAVGDAIGSALDHAHRHGLLHRDVKPANILLSSEDSEPGQPDAPERRRIRLADFGIARQTDGGTALTSANLVIGSFPYSSPEQLSGQTLDARSDVYSLACSLFEFLTGTVPFTGPTPAMLIHHHLVTPPPAVSDLRRDVPRAVSDAVRHGLAKNPADRPLSAGSLAAELRSAIDTTGFFPIVARTGPAMSARTQLAATQHAPTAAIPTAQAPPLRSRSSHSASPAHGFPTVTAYSELPDQTVSGPDPGASTVRASRDLPVLDVLPNGPAATRRTTASLACGVAALPLSVVGGLGLPVGVAGWYLAGRGVPSSAGRLAKALCIAGIVLSVAFIGFTVGHAMTIQF